LTRAAILIATVPLLVRGTPIIIRLALGLVVGAGLLPAAIGSLGPTAPASLAPLIAKEALVGLAISLVAGAAVWAAEVAGRLTDASRRDAPAPESPLGEVFALGAISLLLAAGGHGALLRLAADSYALLPPDQAITISGAGAALGPLLRGTGSVLAVGIAIAVPALVVTLAIRGADAAARRVGPWLRDHALRASAPSLAAIGISALVAGLLQAGLDRTLSDGLRTGRELLRALGSGP